MKKLTTIMIVVLILALQSVTMQVKAEVMPLSSDDFKSAKIIFSSSGETSFIASTCYTCTTIRISSCILQKKIENNWIVTRKLDCPEPMSNTCRYWKEKNYSTYMSSGVTYRIIATFDADGATTTVVSDEKTISN